MKYSLPIIVLFLSSCTKKEVGLNTGWNAKYHIEGVDTISSIFFPNSFSPNGDGTNDNFKVLTENITNDGFEILIFRNSGENLFKSTNIITGWDGTHKGVKSANGIYYYTLHAKDSSAYEYKCDGSMYLIR